jgi:hypothetical protein
MCPGGKKRTDPALMPLPNRNRAAVMATEGRRIFLRYLRCYRSCVKS